MRNLTCSILVLLCCQQVYSQTSQDSLMVIETVEMYVNSFYLTQPKGAEKSVHEQLAKRTIEKFNDGSEFLNNMTVEQMVNLAKVFNQRGNFSSQSRKDITILDMMNKTASVKLSAQGWVDYMHLGKINGEWKIINILWQRD